MSSLGSLGASRLSRFSRLLTPFMYFSGGERVGVSSRQDHGHSEPARDRDEGVEEDPKLENIEPFSEGNDDVT
jgi:hypothetical protein